MGPRWHPYLGPNLSITFYTMRLPPAWQAIEIHFQAWWPIEWGRQRTSPPGVRETGWLGLRSASHVHQTGFHFGDQFVLFPCLPIHGWNLAPAGPIIRCTVVNDSLATRSSMGAIYKDIHIVWVRFPSERKRPVTPGLRSIVHPIPLSVQVIKRNTLC